jgi:hypothetical protein
MHLTDIELRALPFEQGQKDYTDDAGTGLSVRIGRRRKTFVLLIRRGDKRERATLGHYPDLFLSQARERARDLLAEARLSKEDEPAAMTFTAAFDQFKAIHIPTMRPGSQEQAIRLLTTRFAALSHRRLTDLKTSELAATIDSICASSSIGATGAATSTKTQFHGSRLRAHLNPGSESSLTMSCAAFGTARLKTVLARSSACSSSRPSGKANGMPLSPILFR